MKYHSKCKKVMPKKHLKILLTCIASVVFSHCLHELLRPIVLNALNDFTHPEAGSAGEFLYQLC